MPEEKRYRITRERAARPIDLADFGVLQNNADVDVGGFRTMFSATVTVDEYRAMFGGNSNIVLDMCYVAHTPVDRIALHVVAHDVLSVDSWNTMQQVMVNAFLEDAGDIPMGDAELETRARGYHDISPEAVLFLMQMYDRAASVNDVDKTAELERAREAGLTLADFLR